MVNEANNTAAAIESTRRPAAKRLTKTEQAVVDRIARSPKGCESFNRYANGRRVMNAVRKLAAEGIIRIEYVQHGELCYLNGGQQ